MALFLKLLGGVSLVFLLLVAAFLLWLGWQLRKAKKGLSTASSTPSTIDLTLDADPVWLKKPQVQRDLAALESCSFTRGPAYQVEGINGVRLIALHHATNGAHGCYYDHPAAGNWTDLWIRFSDGLDLTVGNAPRGSELDTRPGTEKIILPGKPVTELHARLTERLTGRATTPVPAAEFKTAFIAAYAKDMAWRNSKNGTSEVEFMRIAANHKTTLTDAQLKEAFKETKLGELEQWSSDALAAFEKSTTLSVAEWKEYEHSMIILRDNFHPRAFLDYLTDTISLPDEAVAKYGQALDEGLTLEALLTKIAEDTGNEFVRLGEVDQPVKVQIYGVKSPPETAAG